MTVILVLVTFFGFIALDWFLHRGKVPAVASAHEPAAVAHLNRIAGFLAPDNLRYHAGHAWLERERRNIARTGVDEFAAALAGDISKIELPKPGQWVRQGQKAWTLHRNGETTEMVSPIEGEVIEVNPDVLKNPALLREDPYGRGWLMTVNVPDEESTTRNLIPGTWFATGCETQWSGSMRCSPRPLLPPQPMAANLPATCLPGCLPTAISTGRKSRDSSS